MAVPGWGEYFTKVYLLRPKIKCNSPHSRPGRVPRPRERAPREGSKFSVVRLEALRMNPTREVTGHSTLHPGKSLNLVIIALHLKPEKLTKSNARLDGLSCKYVTLNS